MYSHPPFWQRKTLQGVKAQVMTVDHLGSSPGSAFTATRPQARDVMLPFKGSISLPVKR